MRRNDKFGAKNINFATTIGERKITGEIFCLALECHLQLKVNASCRDEASTNKKYSSKYRVLTVLKVLE